MMIAHSKQKNNLSEVHGIEVDHEEIGRVSKIECLSLAIDEDVSWTDQCRKVKTWVIRGFIAIWKLTDIIPQSRLAAVYRALSEGQLSCGSRVWRFNSDAKLSTLPGATVL